MTNSTNTLNAANNTTVASSSSVPDLPKSAINPFGVEPITPRNVQSKLNPAVAAFTPSKSDEKDSADLGSAQAFSPSKTALEPPLTATSTEEEGFIPPHRDLAKTSIQEEPTTSTKELSADKEMKNQSTVATGDQTETAEEVKPLQTTSLFPRVLPHLRRVATEINAQDSNPRQVQQRSSKGKSKENTIEENEFLSREPGLTGSKEEMRAAGSRDALVSRDPGLRAWLDAQEKLQNNDSAAHSSASTDNDMLIDF